MRPATSLYLDALRIAAAAFVFFDHCAEFWSPSLFAITLPIAHAAVVVFFVLSGYVIAYATLTRERDPRRYALARLSRLYSVVLPALALTLVLQIAGHALNPAFYAAHSRGLDGIRYVLTTFFLQDVWRLAASPPTNSPFWSLSYEFWYYVLFGVSIFVRRGGLRTAALLALCLLIGPNILLLLPCWLAGVAIFARRDQLAALVTRPRLAFACSLAALAALMIFLPPWPYGLDNPRFWFSGAFLKDWMIALALAASIVSFDALRLSPPHRAAIGWTRYCADHTFSLYLYHYPLLAFATALLRFPPATWWTATVVAGAVLGIVLALGTVTEARRAEWRRFFERMIDWTMAKTSPAVSE